MPRVSVLIPTWNREKYLGEAVESVLNQTYRDFEVVVVDDGSTDGTEDLVRRFGRVRYVWQPHSGIPAARNRALAEARGEFVAWLDSDDLYVPDKLEKQVAYLDAHPECEIVFCLVQSFSSIADCDMTGRQSRVAEAVGGRLRTCVPSACIRRALLERYGGFDEKYPYAEDTQWVARICAAGVDVRHCMEERLYRCRIHDGQISCSHEGLRRQDSLSLYADAIRNAKRKGMDAC